MTHAAIPPFSPILEARALGRAAGIDCARTHVVDCTDVDVLRDMLDDPSTDAPDFLADGGWEHMSHIRWALGIAGWCAMRAEVGAAYVEAAEAAYWEHITDAVRDADMVAYLHGVAVERFGWAR
jgi:hypothetical protein